MDLPFYSSLPVRMSVQIGGIARDKLIAGVDDISSDSAKAILNSDVFKVSEKPKSVDLVALCPRELGFKKRPPVGEFLTPEFCSYWSGQCLDRQTIELCEPEYGPQAVLRYYNQPHGEYLWMAMTPVIISPEVSLVFLLLRNSDKVRLSGSYARAQTQWSLDNPLLFRLRRTR